MVLRLTQAAVTQALAYQKERPEWKAKGLRLWVSGKNCEGLLYGVTFDLPQPDDKILIQEGVAVLVDPDTVRYVEGVSIDFVDDDRGRGFLVSNPNAKKYAGKFYLKQTP